MSIRDSIHDSFPQKVTFLQDEWRIRIERTHKRVRVKFAEQWVADSKRVLLVTESGSLPVYYFPLSDVNRTLLEPSDYRTEDIRKGEASYWHVSAGARTADNAARCYNAASGKLFPLADYIAFHWGAMDHWYEEDVEVFKHARDPYTRVDAVQSSRSITVVHGEKVIAESRRPVLVFETGLVTRFYLDPADVRTDLLIPSATRTRCPYKGEATYWSLQTEDGIVEDVVWSYANPTPEVSGIRGLLCFYSERLDALYVDGLRWTLASQERLPYKNIAGTFL